MNKAELASYLASLHLLLEAQSKGVHSVPSRTLAEEYERSWKAFKEAIQKDIDDETRKCELESKRDEDGTEATRSRPGLRSPIGDTRGGQTSRRADV